MFSLKRSQGCKMGSFFSTSGITIDIALYQKLTLDKFHCLQFSIIQTKVFCSSWMLASLFLLKSKVTLDGNNFFSIIGFFWNGSISWFLLNVPNLKVYQNTVLYLYNRIHCTLLALFCIHIMQDISELTLCKFVSQGLVWCMYAVKEIQNTRLKPLKRPNSCLVSLVISLSHMMCSKPFQATILPKWPSITATH